jgi:hypothetical protein
VKHSAALGALAAAALLALGSACGGSDSGDEAKESTRCENVPLKVVNEIEREMTVSGGGTLTNAQAVKSEDFERVYFVSAEIDGAGLEGSGDIGTWAKSGSLRSRRGAIFSVDAVANEFSDWFDGRTAGPHLSMDDDGAEESKDCVEDTG